MNYPQVAVAFALGVVALPALLAAYIFWPRRIFCPLLGHDWRPFDMNWCGIDYLRCRRCLIIKSQPTGTPL